MTLTLNRFRRTSTAIAALGAALIAGTAYAGGPAAPSLTVSYGDLNLTSAQGADALYARVTAAAKQVCGADRLDIRDLQAYAAARACESQAVTRAVHDVRAPQFAAHFAARREHS